MPSLHDDISVDDLAVPVVPNHEHTVPVADGLIEEADWKLTSEAAPSGAGQHTERDEEECRIKLPDGCYRLTYRPSASAEIFRGTLRVDRGEGKLVISGDLYRFLRDTDGSTVAAPADAPTFRSVVASGVFADLFDSPDIPVYPRARYHSYLRGTGAKLRSIVDSEGKCEALLAFEQYDYSQPPLGNLTVHFQPLRGVGPSSFGCVRKTRTTTTTFLSRESIS